MKENEPRAVLERLIRERKEDYAALSRLIGRNAAYVQQFIRRGVPKKLAENDRRLLARYFGVDEQLLGGPPPEDGVADPSGLVPIARFQVSAAAGHGSFPEDERRTVDVGFSPGWLRKFSSADPKELALIQVEGDSMGPTLSDGDDILVDLSAARGKFKDGIYVLRRDDALQVKRLTLHPVRATLTIASDNPAYATWADCSLDDIQIVGRVIWAGRRMN